VDKTGRAVLWFAPCTARGALQILPWVEVFLRHQRRYFIRRCQRIENATTRGLVNAIVPLHTIAVGFACAMLTWVGRLRYGEPNAVSNAIS
jgi:hypothetical protein